MSDFVVQKAVCYCCYAVLDIGDNYCRHCGAPTANLAGSSPGGSATASRGVNPAAASTAAPQPRSSESPWIVLPLIFLILGPFGLPLLWRSRRFTLLWKSIVTIVVLGLTAMILWGIWFILHQALAPLREFDQLRSL
jgi:hypothetical protein